MVAKEDVLTTIRELVAAQQLEAAEELLRDYRVLFPQEAEGFSIATVIKLMRGDLTGAEKELEDGLLVAPQHQDLLFNKAYCLECRQEWALAAKLYAEIELAEENMAALQEARLRVAQALSEQRAKQQRRLVVFVKPQMDAFVKDIVEALADEYEVCLCQTTSSEEIDEKIEWADICWFEWCDELLIYGSQLEMADRKQIICRLHSYEAFTEYPQQVNWGRVDTLIFVAEHIRSAVLELVPTLAREKTVVIPNGIDVKRYTFRNHKPGFSIAYVGYINYKKGPMLLLHAFKAIVERDSRYKLFIAGVFQDQRDVLYFRQTIQKMGLENNVFFQGWQDDIDKWLNDKDYLLCTSILESQGMGIMQAMSKGIKPVIHNFVGAEAIYGEKYVWTTIAECVAAITDSEYNPKEYRRYIETNFALDIQLEKIRQRLALLSPAGEEMATKPVVTVGIINYNYAHYLDESIGSVLMQTYGPIEILVVDDCSTDGSRQKLQEYERQHSNVRVIYHEQNSGSAARAMREFIAEAKGQYLAILSADDYFSDTRAVEHLVGQMALHGDIDYVYCNLDIVDVDGNKTDTWAYNQYTNREMILETFRRHGSGVVPITVGMFKMDFFRRNKLTWYDDKEDRIADGLNLAADTLNVLRYGKAGLQVRHFDKALMAYRQHENNMTHNLERRITSVISVIEYIIDNFSETIYFPDVKWDEFELHDRMAAKMLLLGVHYHNMFEFYYNDNWRPWGNANPFTKAEIKRFLQPAVDQIRYYLAKSSQLSDAYRDQIQELEEKLASAGYPRKKAESIKLSRISQEDIVQQGHALRSGLLREYAGKYAADGRKMLLLSPDNGAWRYTFQSWKSVLEYMGVSVDLVTTIDRQIDYGCYDIFLTIANPAFINQTTVNRTIQRIGNRIGIAAKDSFSPVNSAGDLDLLHYLVQEKPFQFLITSSNETGIKYAFADWLKQGVKIYSVPFGFNPLIHYPEYVQKEYDYFFVGHNSYLKAEETQKYLAAIFQQYRGVLRGTGWDASVSELSPQDVRTYYNRAKINLNYHLKVQKEQENEVNERTYIIGACGGFQLVDNPKYLSHLYGGKEMAIAGDEREYLDMFKHYLNKSDERLEMSYHALVKTYKNKSSLFTRMDDWLKLLK